MELRIDPELLSEEYAAARPFPHAVIDELFPAGVLDAVLAEFPSSGEKSWRTFDNPMERKSGFDYRSPIHDRLRDFLYFLNSAPMLEFLEALTGIGGLIPDPYFGGAGPHESPPGGFLKVHVDFNWHPKLKLDRRVNLLIYLNQDWRDEYGGHLELWDRDVERCERKILPAFNRAVVFNTTDFSYHGHPQPLCCPAGMSRKSISMYYYTAGRPEDERTDPHDTIFKETPSPGRDPR